MLYDSEISGGMIYSYIPGFVDIGMGDQATLRYFLRNQRGWNVSRAGGRIL